MSEIIRNDAGGLSVADSPDKFAVDPVPGIPGADLQDVLNGIGTAIVLLKRDSLLRTGNATDLVFDTDDSGYDIGTLSSFTEILGVSVGVNTANYPFAVTQSLSPMEILGEAGDKVWVRIDKLGRPLKSHPTIYVGANGAPLSSSGLTADDGFVSFFYMSDMFFNSMDGMNTLMEIVLDAHAPNPIIPGGDFGGGIAIEASAGCVAGDVLMIQTDGTVVPCIADSDAHLALVLGVAANRAVLPDVSNPRKAVVVAYRDLQEFNPETGITFVAGDKMYVSASEAGHVTNIAPAHARQVGLCTSNDESGVLGLVRI